MGDYTIFWAVMGFAMILLELFLPGFVVVFFGLGALAAAVFSFLPLVGASIPLQILVFLLSSVLSLRFLRKRFRKLFKGSSFETLNVEDASGKLVVVTEDIVGSKGGRIRHNGTVWKAICEDALIKAGSKVEIIGREGLTFIVARPLGESGEGGEIEERGLVGPPDRRE